MKKKILDIVVDIILFTIVFGITDWITRNVWKTDKIMPELLTYLVLYVFVFGLKRLIQYIWNKKISERK